MVLVDQLAETHLSSVLPLSVVMAARTRVRVRSRTVFTSVAPLAAVRVAIDVHVLTRTTSLVVRPLAFSAAKRSR